jgi:hypothetical protein
MREPVTTISWMDGSSDANAGIAVPAAALVSSA